MAGLIQVTHENETTSTDDLDPEQITLFGGKTDSGLIQFSIKTIFLIAIFIWFQSGNSDQNLILSSSNFLASNISVNYSSLFSSAKPELSTHSVYPTIQKNCIGSDDDPVRLNPDSKCLTGILEPIVKTEVVDESIHPENYTPKTSKAIQREAEHQRSDTFLQDDNKVVSNEKKEEPFGTIVYTGEHFKEMENYSATFASVNQQTKTNVSPSELGYRLSKPVARFTANKETTKVSASLKNEIESFKISTVKIASLQLSNIAALDNVASINSSDNASTTKLTNQLNNLKVDETEAVASASLAKESFVSSDVTSVEFNELRLKAFENDKKMLVRFTASWCVPCKMMEENVYANPTVKAYMDQHFLSMKLDVESFDGINLKQVYGVQLLPSFLIFNSDGDLAGHFKKSISSKEMLKILKKQIGEGNTINGTDSLSKSENDNGNWEMKTGPITR